MKLIIQNMAPDDWHAVRIIYQEGIDTGQATFETAVPSWEEWDKSKLPVCRMVAKVDGSIAGWAALSTVTQREVYAGLAEVSIYVSASVRGHGVGKSLLQKVVENSERAGYWMLQAVMFPENEASVALHCSCGFRIVGRREKVARHLGVWRDTVLLERRSKVVGV